MTLLPSGTVTFLFTDIEGSTRLLEQLGSHYATLLAEQQQLLRQACERHRGCVVDTQGDSFFMAFARAADAIQVVVEAQQALHAHAWPQGVSVRVRMGLHTGEPTLAGDRYVGIDVHRAARIGAAAHGGQTLLSRATREIVAAELPGGVTLRDLGEHRLKDLRTPKHLFQLDIQGLPSDFPPLRTLDVLPNNLPVQLTSFVGREQEIAEVEASLQATRLLTLTGPGGAGKTRLALQVAGNLVGQFKDGVWWVALDAVADPELIAPTVAAALGIRDDSTNLSQRLADYLRSKQLLLLLDNCEHLIDACAQWADRWLRAAPALKILATSREALGIAGESVYHVTSLAVPDLRAEITAETLALNDATRLFIERARAVSNEFRATDQNAAAIAQICRRLDGIPLALELAAARVKALTVQQIAARLDDVFRLLTGGSRAGLARQQTLAAAIDWSYNLLSPTERLLLQRLSVFAGGFTLEAVEQVCAGEEISPNEVLDLLTRLVDKSLVVVDRAAGDQARYSMLDTIRQFARYRLFQSEEIEGTNDRHGAWCLTLAERAEPELRGPDQLQWLNRLETEHDNLRGALAWALQRKQVEPALRLVGDLIYFWEIHGHSQEGRQWIEKALALAETDPAARRSGWRARALLGYGVLSLFDTEASLREPRLEEALEIFREQADAFGIGYALYELASIPYRRMNYVEAYARFQESLKVREAAGDRWGAGNSLHCMAHAADLLDDRQAARELFEESIRLLRTVGDRWSLFHPLQDSAGRHWFEGDLTAARSEFEEILTTWRELGNPDEVSWTGANLGRVARDQGDFEAARQYTEQAKRIAGERGDKEMLGWSWLNLGSIALCEGNWEEARRALAAALELLPQADDKVGVGIATSYLGQLEVLEGNLSCGVGRLQEALTRLERINAFERYIALYGLGEAARRQGKLDQAAEWYTRMLQLVHQTNKQLRAPDALEGLAKIAARRGKYQSAANLLGAAERLRDRMGAPLKPADRAEYESVVKELKAGLGEDQFSAEWTRGGELTFEQVVARACEG